MTGDQSRLSAIIGNMIPMTALAKYTHDFRTTYGKPIPDTFSIDIEERVLVQSLIEEECAELVQASQDDDLIEMVDAWGDLAWVAYNAAWAHGYNLDPEVYQFASPLLETSIKAPSAPTLYAPRRLNVQRFVEFTVRTLSLAQDSDKKIAEEVIPGLWGAVVASTFFAANEHGVDLNAVLAEIARSNMSKLGADGKPIYREDGKVLKGPNYSPPDIAGVLQAQGEV